MRLLILMISASLLGFGTVKAAAAPDCGPLSADVAAEAISSGNASQLQFEVDWTQLPSSSVNAGEDENGYNQSYQIGNVKGMRCSFRSMNPGTAHGHDGRSLRYQIASRKKWLASNITCALLITSLTETPAAHGWS